MRVCLAGWLVYLSFIGKHRDAEIKAWLKCQVKVGGSCYTERQERL